MHQDCSNRTALEKTHCCFDFLAGYEVVQKQSCDTHEARILAHKERGATIWSKPIDSDTKQKRNRICTLEHDCFIIALVVSTGESMVLEEKDEKVPRQVCTDRKVC
eukprot:1158537-Pelagomonas_calceolata.AAC.13